MELSLHKERIESWYAYKNAYVHTRSLLRPAHELRPPRNEMVFLHGRYADSRGCDPLSELLEPQLGFLSVDFPGFGTSYFTEGPLTITELLELAVAVCRRKLAENPGARLVLAGHDFGALIAQLAACVLSDAPGASNGLDLILINPLTLSWERMNQVPRWFYGSVARRELRRFLRQSPLLGEKQKSQIMAPRRAVLARIIQSWPDTSESATWRQRMARFSGSLLVLWGARDFAGSRLSAKEIFDLYPHTEYFEHERAGHWPFLEDPEWVAEKIRLFLFRTDQLRKTA